MTVNRSWVASRDTAERLVPLVLRDAPERTAPLGTASTLALFGAIIAGIAR